MSQPEMIGAFCPERVLCKYPEYMSDLFGVSYIEGGTAMKGFGKHTSIFNDNVTIKLKTIRPSTPASLSAARLAIKQAFGDGVRVMKANNNRVPTFVQFLVTLPDTAIDAVLDTLEVGLPILRDAGLALSDLDFTLDCENITTRADVERWIDGRYVVADRRDKTGDNCISWWIEHPLFEKLRGKVYNKAVQMIESGGVRVTIGSSMHEYIADGVSVQNTMINYKEAGVSRLEITFYGETLYSADTYKDIIMDIYNKLGTCDTYSNSLANQWKALEPRLTQSLAVYDPESRIFAICQWWNSLTGKMHGMSTTLKPDDIMKLLANYSYNSRPAHLITVTDRNEAIASYIRVGTAQPVTMLPGVKGGLYTARKDGMKRLQDYGIGAVTPGRLDWVPSMCYRSKALADLEPYKQNEPDVESLTRDLENLAINNKTFEAVYVGLKPESTYTIVGTGRAMFRKNECVYVTTSTGQRVRCGTYLKKIVEEREVRGLSSIFAIRTGREVTCNGCKDMQCFII